MKHGTLEILASYRRKAKDRRCDIDLRAIHRTFCTHVTGPLCALPTQQTPLFLVQMPCEFSPVERHFAHFQASVKL